MHMATGVKRWTLEEVHSLPDDGNKYELVRGELFVTPPPTPEHETILGRLTRMLDPYVAAKGLGLVYHARAVVRFQGSEAEPDLFVRQPDEGKDWDEVSTPVLIVEVLSGSTRRRDQVQKRQLYLDMGVAEYWMLDPERREVRVVRRDTKDLVSNDVLEWRPPGVAEPLVIRLAEIFGIPAS